MFAPVIIWIRGIRSKTCIPKGSFDNNRRDVNAGSLQTQKFISTVFLFFGPLSFRNLKKSKRGMALTWYPGVPHLNF